MLARKFLYVIAAIILLILALGVGWSLFQMQILRWTLVPPSAFAAPAGAVDYAKAENWVSRPGLPNDPSAYVPAGFKADPKGPVATFFVAPTTYLGRDRWNAPIGDASAEPRLKLFVASQASVFNGLGPVWAPRYRQATAGAFLTPRPDAQKALDFAYRDVEAAFDRFLAEIPSTQPILLAGHSQGSLHLLTLLARRIAGTPTAKRIVAVYLVGWPVSVSADLPKLGLPACARSGQSGCILSWQSFAQPADPELLREAYDRQPAHKGTPMLCVNPLTGTPGATAPAAANIGALVPDKTRTSAEFKQGLVPAGCDASGLLIIGPAPEGYGGAVLPGNNYHVFDYALFWANIRRDAAARAASFRGMP